MESIARKLSSPGALDDALRSVAHRLFAAEDSVPRHTAMLVADDFSAAAVVALHPSHRYKPGSAAERRARACLADILTRLGVDPENTPAVMLARLGRTLVVLYKTLCLDWVRHRYRLARLEDAPGKLHRQEMRMPGAVALQGPAAVPDNWAGLVQTTAETHPACRACGRSPDAGKFRACGRCGLFRYCSRECQARHWREHKAMCGKYRAAEGKSFAAFNAFVAAYAGPVDPDAAKRYVNGATVGRVHDFRGQPALEMDCEQELRAHGLDTAALDCSNVDL